MTIDTARMLQELEIMTATLFPDIDIIKLKSRYEEVLDNYDVSRRSTPSLENDMEDKINSYLSARKMEGLSFSTLAGYEQELTMFNRFVNKPAISVNTCDVRRYLASDKNLKIGTVQKKLSAIKSFFEWLVDEEMLLKNPTKKIKGLKHPKRLPKSMTAEELEMLREACLNTRERALIEVLYSTGCRLSEVSNMKQDDVDWSSGAISVIGKGNKERVVYLNSRSKYYLERYLNSREENEDRCKYLFTTIRRPYRKMQNKTIQDAVRKIASRTDINKNIHPHVFRHTMATLAMESGIELGDLQQLLGHESANTTLRYISVNENRKRQAHKRFVQ